ncbi:MAG: hypothetical protein PUD85_03210 [Bacteroidales bacterium]|nr:hypothetical protein [Bacteroidales bacterium]
MKITDREREGWEKALSECFDSPVQEGGAAAGWDEVCDRLAVRRRRRVAARSALALCCSALLLGGLALSLRPQGVESTQILLAQEQSAVSGIQDAEPVGEVLTTESFEGQAREQTLTAQGFEDKALEQGLQAEGFEGEVGGERAATRPSDNRATEASGSKESPSADGTPFKTGDAPFKTGNALAMAQETPGRRRGPKIGLGLEIGGMPATSGTLNISGGGIQSAVQRFDSPGVDVFQASGEAISNSAKYRHHMPLGAGLKIGIGLTERLSLTTGLNYTLLWSELQPLGSEGKSDQFLHYIGLPLGAEYRLLSKGAFSLSAGAGVFLDFLAAAYIDKRKVDDKPLQWTANLNAAALWELSGKLSLYLQPELNWYISKTGINSIRNDSPLGATLRVGLRLNL